MMDAIFWQSDWPRVIWYMVGHMLRYMVHDINSPDFDSAFERYMVVFILVVLW